MTRISFLSIAILSLIGSNVRGEWKPAAAPLMTHFAKDVSPDKVHPEYPRPQLVRKEWVNLNGLWNYAITPKDAVKPAKWDGEILVPFCVESALSGVGKKVSAEQALWYKRTFKKPELPAKGRLLLHFGAVDWHAKVWINGNLVGEHKGGFVPFSFDITEALKVGEGEQEIALWVWDPCDVGAQPRGKQVLKPGGIFYTSVTGIWQTVWLEPLAEASISNVVVTTTELPQPRKPARVQFKIENYGTIKGDLVRVKASREGKVVFVSDAEAGVIQDFPLLDAALWSPTNPNLYDVELSIVRAGTVIDSVASYFAFRQIAVQKDSKGINRLFLNNQPLFQLGTLDQGWWPDGLLTPPTDEALAFDLKKLKQYGFNMLRKHIKVEPARLYYHCDKLGLLVWQDMPSGMAIGRNHNISPDAKQDSTFTEEEKAQFRLELKAMIDHLSPFACIVVWVPFNEGWGQHDTNDILKWTMKYDPTRLVDGPSGWADRGVGHMKDLHMYPGPGMFPIEKERVSVLGEFGGLGLPLEGHLWQPNQNWGYQTFKTTKELRDSYRGLMIRMPSLIEHGLSASVYTQTTDVESEVNGLITYDRKVMKLDEKETAKWHKRLFEPAPETRVLMPTSEKGEQTWSYTIEKPGEDWFKPDFDAGKWATGPGGFGTKQTPNTTVRTEWKSTDIWIRRDFDLKEGVKGELFANVFHDEDAEIYLNGVLAAKVAGYVSVYSLVPISEEAKKALKAGKNSIAIHCHQTTGGQYIDAGLVEWVQASGK